MAQGIEGPSVEEVDRLAASARRLGALLWVSFGGGEPFLRADLPELARSFGSRGLEHLAIPTNGLVSRQHDSVERICAENPGTFLSVSVSIDGPAEVHDRIRGAAGAHAKACAAVRAFLAQKRGRANLGVGIITTVTRENQAVLAQHVAELVRELAPDHLTINLARTDALDRSLLEVDPDRYHEVVAVKQRLEREGVLPGYGFALAPLMRARDEILHERVERLARGDGSAHLGCTAGTLSAVVYEDGRLAPCEVLGQTLGNLREVNWDLERLWNGERARRLRAEIAATRCSCTWECAQSDNVLFHPSQWPRLLAKAVRS